MLLSWSAKNEENVEHQQEGKRSQEEQEGII
jgi:hypothetical protein